MSTRELETEDVIDTFEVSSNMPLGAQWTLAPWIGQSSSDSEGSVVYGGLHMSVIW